MTLREIRRESGMTQKQCADYLGVPLRTYVNYERPDADAGSVKYRYMYEKLERLSFVDEEHGLLSVDKIKAVCEPIFIEYDIGYAYLFGSYAKGLAKEGSDVDLFLYTEFTGIRFFGLMEDLREALHKKVDVLDQHQMKNNYVLINEILKDGVRIYKREQ